MKENVITKIKTAFITTTVSTATADVCVGETLMHRCREWRNSVVNAEARKLLFIKYTGRASSIDMNWSYIWVQ